MVNQKMLTRTIYDPRIVSVCIKYELGYHCQEPRNFFSSSTFHRLLISIDINLVCISSHGCNNKYSTVKLNYVSNKMYECQMYVWMIKINKKRSIFQNRYHTYVISKYLDLVC